MVWIFLAVLLVLVIIVFAYAITIYNGLVYLRKSIYQALSNIDVLLKQRYDELPKLVKICERYMKHEQETLERVIEARNMMRGLGGAGGGGTGGTGGAGGAGLAGGNIGKLAAADGMLSEALRGLFLVVEQYPDLKADRSFAQLQNRVTSLENQIADRREFYNHSVTSYNIRLDQFPDMLIARRIPRFQPEELWQIPDAAQREDPGISWDS